MHASEQKRAVSSAYRDVRKVVNIQQKEKWAQDRTLRHARQGRELAISQNGFVTMTPYWLVGWLFFFYITEQTGNSAQYYDGDDVEKSRKRAENAHDTHVTSSRADSREL